MLSVPLTMLKYRLTYSIYVSYCDISSEYSNHYFGEEKANTTFFFENKIY